MGSNRPFQKTRPASVRRSVFNLSYEKKMTLDFGKLYPVMCDECVPGDVWSIANQSVIRFQPLVAPMLHEINVFVHYFFVPYRLLWPTNEEKTDGWEVFITGGDDGDLTPTLPKWAPTAVTIGTLWDYLGFPCGTSGTVPHSSRLPMTFPRDAYNMIWNEYYRDQNHMDEIDLDNEYILRRCWEKDYFTSALPWQQKGTAPALPVSGLTSAVWPGTAVDNSAFVANEDGMLFVTADSVDEELQINNTGASFNAAIAEANLLNTLNGNIVDLSSATTFDVSDMRLAFQLQRWMERNARCGSRYTEFLKAHFQAYPRDDRLQRPEYIGGTRAPIIISEVLQTSETDTSPQGNLAGHGISVNTMSAGRYRVKEHGLIMGLISVMPRCQYASQGVNRQWLRQTKYDFFFPEFENLSEQAIEKVEIFSQGTTVDAEIFGYQGRYDEMRTKQSMVVGEMRGSEDFDYWHMSRVFSSMPSLNSAFLECNPSRRTFAVPSEQPMVCSFGNILRAVRPLSIQAEPGLIDH